MRQENKTFFKELNKLMLPIAFQTFMLAAVAASDSIMLGLVSQDSLAAVSLASKIQFVQNIGLAALVGGGSVLASQYFGKNDLKKVGSIFSLVLRYSVIISIIFWVISLFIPEGLMRIFTDDINMINIGSKYLRVSSWSYLIVGITQTYLCMLKVSNKAYLSAIISTIAVILNILLNAVFIFGLIGFNEMGAEGAALATVIARIIELILSIIIVMVYKIKFDKRSIISFEGNIEKEFWKISSPILLNEAIWGIGVTIYSIAIGHLGSDATAANSIASVVKDLVTSLCRGIGVGGGILLGYKLGSNKLNEAKSYGNKLVKLSIVGGIICGLIIIATMPITLQMDLSNNAKDYLAIMLIICAFYMVSKSMNVAIINGVFYAGGDSKFDTYCIITTMWLMIIPLALIGTFVFSWPVLVIYLIISLDEVIKIPFVLARYKKYKWLKNLTK